MGFEPTYYPAGSPPVFEDLSGNTWEPILHHGCTFNRGSFMEVMMNMIRNPNVNSSWLFRADILFEDGPEGTGPPETASGQPRTIHLRDFTPEKTLVRRLIPRNTLRDQPLDQTCIVYHGRRADETEMTLVVYNPHYSSASEVPFYHPKVQGLAFLHEWKASTNQGVISIHYHFFDDEDRDPKLTRTALSLLTVLHKHGQGKVTGYVKRVHHDTIIPQIAVQTTYARLKQKYARKLIESWAEVTDPAKHVFEDFGIAAFLIELWAEMYRGKQFPGFVDIGCGNGLLVHILRQEGYAGWGFDARKRKSWLQYDSEADGTSTLEGHPSLREHVLLPYIIGQETEEAVTEDKDSDLLHGGRFPEGTFIISNHADELTPWTPILATASKCPFIMIPCCSHNLTGARYRAPVPKLQSKSHSAYASLVDWVSQIGADCGWEVETEMLRIPSTRNTGLIGRKRKQDYEEIDLDGVMEKYGGTEGYADNVMKLVKQGPRSH
ncbi:uracil-O(2)--methyltransferase [Pestalotiopsis sp. NC0098]|nr:uracil-O(2)--methyltransferase [Pestalotiopsis sp. NC0098]